MTPATASPPRPGTPGARPDAPGTRAFLIGIGGSGMSGLARLLRARGVVVEGVESEPGEATVALGREGIAVGFDQSGAALPQGLGVVIASAAVPDGHPMVVEARRRGVPVLLYAQALGRCMEGHTGVAIAGTHGKSSTTAMLGCALTDAGLDPTVIVGATSEQLTLGCLGARAPATGCRVGSAVVGAGRRAGEPGVLVAEACEYNRSFHNFRAMLASISSVEADHLDCYGTFDAVLESFRRFAGLLPPASRGGRLLIAHEGAHRREVTAGASCEVRTIGFSPEADYVVTYDTGSRGVTLSHERETLARWVNGVAGAHMAFNAGVAMALASWLGAEPARVARSLAAFRGVDRRMQFLGVRKVPGGEVRVFDDYGHHPTEIDVTLRALRESEAPERRGGRLICVFQPHQHSRTRHLLDEFAGAFSQADVVLMPDIYFVRDDEIERTRVTSGDLAERLRRRGVDARHLPTFDRIVAHLRASASPHDLVVCMGAGPVWRIAKDFLES